MTKNSIASVLCASVAAVGLAQVTRAGAISFDPMGTGGAHGVQVNTFDEQPGNVLDVGVFNGGQGQVFDNLYQARMGGLLDVNGNPIPYPGQITVVAHFSLQTTQVIPLGTSTLTVAEFTPAAAARPINFVDFYASPTVTANDLTGTGFTDGVLIMSAVVTSTPAKLTSSVFQEFNTTGLFDNFGPDDYAGFLSAQGIGNTQIQAQVTYFNPAYFYAAVPSQITTSATATDVSGFDTVNPSQKFFDGTVPNIGIPGGVNGLTGPDYQLQSDASSTFVPEPASLALLGLSAMGMCVRQRRRQA